MFVYKAITATDPVSGRELINAAVCDRANPVCMGLDREKSCRECKDVQAVYQSLGLDTTKRVTWYQWELILKKPTKVKYTDHAGVALASLKKQWAAFLIHCFIKNRQASRFDQAKANVDTNTAVIQIDFSENY